METLIIKTEGTTLELIKNFLKEKHIEYTTKKEKKEKPYNPEFVQEILKRAENAQKGNVKTIDPNDLWGSLGLK